MLELDRALQGGQSVSQTRSGDNLTHRCEEVMAETVFTIGHSTHSQERFIELLEIHRITAVCDVRSTPYSQRNPQFNEGDLEKALSGRGIIYRFLGKELGARSNDPACYEFGKVQYEKLAQTEAFQRGLNRVLSGLKENFRVVLMCAGRTTRLSPSDSNCKTPRCAWHRC